MGVYVAALNIPLLIWGWNRLSLRFALYTIFAIVLQSYLLVFLIPYLPSYTADPLLACIFGGLMSGIGAGLVVRYLSLIHIYVYGYEKRYPHYLD